MLLLLTQLMLAQAMPQTEFTALMKRMDSASFTSEQLDLLKALPRNTQLTCAETVKLLGNISFANDQIKAIKILLPYISDLNNRHLIIDSMTFSGDKKTVGKILDKEYAERSNAQVAQQEEQELQQAEQLKQLEQRLRKQAEALRAKELQLLEKEKELLQREKELLKREREILDRESGSTDTKHKQKLEWVGDCPQGMNHKQVALGECTPFTEENFNPLANAEDLLWLKVDQPGMITLKIESGPKTKNCKKLNNVSSTKQKTVYTTQENQLIEVTALVGDWHRDHIKITASTENLRSEIYLEDWQKCR